MGKGAFSIVDSAVKDLTPEQRDALLASRWGEDQALAADPDSYARLMARDADGFQINAGGGEATGGYTEGGFTGQYNDYTKDGTTFSRKREDGLFDAFDADGKYIKTSNDSNAFTTKDYVTFAAIVVGAYYLTGGAAAGSAAGGTSAGAVDAAALGLDGAAAGGGSAAAAGGSSAAAGGASMAEQMAMLTANGVPEATAAEIIGGNAAAYTGAGAGSVSQLSMGAGESLLKEAGTEVAKSTVSDAAKDAVKDKAADTTKGAIIDTAKDAGKDGMFDGISDYLGDAASATGKFITDNRLAPTLLNMGAGIISRYADAREQQRLTDEQRQRYQDGYKSGSGLSLWRSKAKKRGG